MLTRAVPCCRGRLVGVAVDATRLRKTGRGIPQAAYHRDPLSPPFPVNLIRAVRCLQASVLVPLHQRAPRDTRALPVRVEEVSSVTKPSRTADAATWTQDRQAIKTHHLSQRFVEMGRALRQALDAAGGAAKTLVLAGDGSFCHRTCVRAGLYRTELIARTRNNAALCRPAPAGTRRVYDRVTFTPEQVRQDETHPWRGTTVCYGGTRRPIRYKELTDLLWQRGGGRRRLRLLVVAPTPYRKRQSARWYDRQPA
jgi:hypothetical protein